MAELRVKGTGTIKLFENDNTSSVTIASPASLSANKTVTLPDADVTLVSGTMNDATNLSGTVPIANGGTGTTSYTPGITVADQWVVTSAFTGAASPISANLAQSAATAQGSLGSAMTVSSGIWTFPSTGYWLVDVYATFQLASGTAASAWYEDTAIQATTDNATYANVAIGRSSMTAATTDACAYHTNISTIIDVTNTTNVKIKINTGTPTVGRTCMGSAYKETGFWFMRLGDTQNG